MEKQKRKNPLNESFDLGVDVMGPEKPKKNYKKQAYKTLNSDLIDLDKEPNKG